jgi:hypothetical protein
VKPDTEQREWRGDPSDWDRLDKARRLLEVSS